MHGLLRASSGQPLCHSSFPSIPLHFENHDHHDNHDVTGHNHEVIMTMPLGFMIGMAMHQNLPMRIYSQIFAHYLHCGAFVATAWPSLVHDDGAQTDNDNDWSDNDKYSEVPFLACP